MLPGSGLERAGRARPAIAPDALQRFVADAAHELRSPIATLRTRLELGWREAPDLSREALTDVGRVQGLATDLLLLARLDAGEPLRADEVDLGQTAAEEALRTRANQQRPMDADCQPARRARARTSPPSTTAIRPTTRAMKPPTIP
ncbi:histidine kinase dimerization/phospho-acceptor domain-containing protein [Microtetraspora malaysiensis]|uniref:histidine kinase dimerization/phospho-acceptor domain-containing protein n=1 Tax=Microtetraspora malaysiensis TaxID=161358 RepID=UPI003D94FF9C